METRSRRRETQSIARCRETVERGEAKGGTSAMRVTLQGGRETATLMIEEERSRAREWGEFV
jgi:hypothetical protein